MFSWNYAQQFKNKLSIENSLLRTSSDPHPKKDIVELKKGCESKSMIKILVQGMTVIKTF